MDITEICIVGAIIIIAIVMGAYYTKGKRRFLKVMFGVCSGIAVLYPAQFIIGLFGQSISINLLTISVSAVMGIPGVALISALSFI